MDLKRDWYGLDKRLKSLGYAGIELSGSFFDSLLGDAARPASLKIQDNNQSVTAERAVLVGLILPDSDHGATRYDPLAELAGLTAAAGAEVVGRVIQKRGQISSSTYIGRGKVNELAEYAAAKEADVVVFDNELAPSQIREVERIIKHRVIDRTELILDIFASRARTHSARLQVELAQLEYTAPRLRGMWSHLERIAGAGGGTTAGAVGGVGTRGPGERQIEIDRRLVQKRVTFLKNQLANIDKRKIREVKSRSDYYTISLVGYTNAGKSTLMNALTDADTLVEDKLFATLDTKTRKWNLGGGQVALLSDTVGFVRNLPHQLVASFRATLEETVHADLLLHVVDASSHDAPGQIKAVDKVLDEIGCHDTPRLNVLNKVDALDDESSIHILRANHEDAVEISARTGKGIDELTERILDRVRGRYRRVTLEASATNGRLLSYLSQYAHILDRSYTDGTMQLDVRLPTQELPRVLNLGATVISSE